MNYLTLLYLAAVLAGFSLIYLAEVAASFVGAFGSILIGIGAVAVIVFSLALLYLALRALFNKL